ncbi:MAG: hypothetical protein ACI8X5_003555 [Planctomycetota bacterium]|jgi:hypothetical protein
MKILGLALAAAAVFAPMGADSVKIGDLAPEIYGEWFLSESSTLEALRGQVVLVDFWRTW